MPHFYGLMTVKGRFDRYVGTLNLTGHPAVELVIEADSLDTKKEPRDKHLRDADFFDVSNHPQVRFEADDATLNGDTLQLRGQLYTAGKNIPLDVTPHSQRPATNSRSKPAHSLITASSG